MWAFGYESAIAIIETGESSTLLFCSGEIISIFPISIILASLTVTVADHEIVSSVNSATFTVKVHDFFIISHCV